VNEGVIIFVLVFILVHEYITGSNSAVPNISKHLFCVLTLKPREARKSIVIVIIAILCLVWFILRPCQHDDGYIDGRSQIQVQTDEQTQVNI